VTELDRLDELGHVDEAGAATPSDVPPALEPLSKAATYPRTPEEASLGHLNTRFLSMQVLHQMRAAGMERPKGIPISHWEGVKRLRPQHENMALMFAAGRTRAQVAAATGYTPQRITSIERSPIMQLRIRELREKFFGDQLKSSFQQMLQPAQQHYSDILNDRIRVKAEHKSEIAERVFNRVLGKPKESVEVTNKSVQDLWTLLDSMKKGENVLDITPTPAPAPLGETVPLNGAMSGAVDTSRASLEPPKAPRNDDPFAAIDAWVARLTPEPCT